VEAGGKAAGADAEFLKTARKRLALAIDFEVKNREAALEDLKFLAGDQWPADVRADRTSQGEKRPTLTINRLKGFVHQVTNNQRENRPSIRCKPKDAKGHPEVAKILDGYFRRMQRDCDADVAFDTAFMQTVAGGWGFWRIGTDYEAPDSFDQIVLIQRIPNQFTTYLDPAHIHPCGIDAGWAFVTEMLDRSEFEEQYPKASPIPFEISGIGEDMKHWVSGGQVRIAEYFLVDKDTRTLVALDNGHIGWKDELSDEIMAAVEASPERIVRAREVEVRKIKWYKLSGLEILEEGDVIGDYIPLVKVIGDEINIQGKPIWSGLVRDAKDPQRMYNYWSSAETERAALAPKAPYIMEEGQVEGHENRWRQANRKNYPYLLYKGTNVGGKPAPPPQRQPPGDVPAGIIAAKQAAAEDLKATTGIRFDATMQERMHDESGRALQELRRQGDIGAYHYDDNLNRALVQTGRIILSILPEIWDTEREITISHEDGREEVVIADPRLAVPYEEHQTQAVSEKRFNIAIGRYDVEVVAGPSYATRRQDAASSMMDFLKTVPNVAPVMGDLVAKNMDWPGSEEIEKRLKKLLPPQLLTPEDARLPPMAQAIIAQMQQQLQQMGQERQQLLQEVADKKALLAQGDKKIERDYDAKIKQMEKTFEGKLLQIQADLLKQQKDQSHEANMARFTRLLDVMEQQFMPHPTSLPPMMQEPPTGNGMDR
jgi:hypothetical protein